MSTDAVIVKRWKAKLAIRVALRKYAERQVAYWTKRAAKSPTAHERTELADRKRKLASRRIQESYARRIIRRHTPQPLRLRALAEAHRLADLRVVEVGGNNRGTWVERIIRRNGGAVGEPWCGDFVAWCYRVAGSKAVARAWASVAALGALSGVKRTLTPRPGDLVRFTFSHVGLFIGWCDANGRATTRANATHIRTIEGNTGDAGAVSDSRGGGDGVKEKLRPIGLVLDYRTVTR